MYLWVGEGVGSSIALVRTNNWTKHILQFVSWTPNGAVKSSMALVKTRYQTKQCYRIQHLSPELHMAHLEAGQLSYTNEKVLQNIEIFLELHIVQLKVQHTLPKQGKNWALLKNIYYLSLEFFTIKLEEGWLPYKQETELGRLPRSKMATLIPSLANLQRILSLWVGSLACSFMWIHKGVKSKLDGIVQLLSKW